MDAPQHPVRFVTAASLFDGHDASINIMRRILQRHGAEVIHLGHNRSVDEVVTAAIQEDVQGVAVSSYQGGHVEYFTYLVELLRERGAGHVKVYGGGGGVIVPREIALLHERGVARIFSPEDGQQLGLPGMIDLMIRGCDVDLAVAPASVDGLYTGDPAVVARLLTLAENGRLPGVDLTPRSRVPVLGITGTGRVGQVVADRRAGAPVPARPGGQAADRRARRRPDPPARRGSAARRPDPDERPRRGAGVLPVDGDARGGRAAARAPGRRARRAEGRRVRPGDRRDSRDRAGRRRHRPLRGPRAVRDDPGVRCRVPAREDRHARLRRRRRDQQVRAARCRRRPARRRPPARPQPRGVRRRMAGHAGVRHERGDFRRRRRHRAVPPPARPAGEGRPRRRRGPPDAPGGKDVHPARRGAPAEPRALRRGDRRDRARVSRRHRAVGGARAAAPAPADGAGGRRRARGGRAGGGRAGAPGLGGRIARHVASGGRGVLG